MRAALAIAGFELRTKLARVSTVVYFSVFTALATLWMAAAGGVFQNMKVAFSSDKVYINSPYAIAQTITVLGLLGVVTIAAFMGRAIQQDFEYQSSHFFFTSPIAKRDYLLGRYLGAAALLFVIFLGIGVGVLLGTHWPGVEAERVGPWSFAAFARPYLVMLLPNVLFLGAVFFTLAALTRRMIAVYIAGAVVLIGWLAGARLLADIDNRTIAALLDPIGSQALGLATRYWSPAEKNARLVPLAGDLAWNRALWLAVGFAFLAFCYLRFRMETEGIERAPRRGLLRRRAPAPIREVAEPSAPRAVALPSVAADTRGAAYLRQLPGLVRLYLRETVKSPYFVAIAFTGALFILANAKVIGSLYGTNTYPVTYLVIDFAGSSFGIFMLVILTLYAGELVWRERDARLALIADSLPVPGWLPLAAKLATLFLVAAVLQLVVLACGVLIQLFSGYTRIELGHYLFHLFVLELPRYWMIACLALFVHVAVDNKYLGHFLMVAYYIASAALAGFGYTHWIYHFGFTPSVTYSDMNGYGHFLRPIPWFYLYWAAACLLLVLAARLLWVRGTDTEWRARFAIARGRVSMPVKSAAGIAVAVLAIDGAWIYYNTDILNHYRSEYAQDDRNARYEKAFKQYATRPQPKLTGVRIAVDLYPHEHRVRAKATYSLRNKADAPIGEIYVTLPERLLVHRFEASIPLTLADEQREIYWRRYTLAHPLAPGESMTVDFDVEYAPHGFANDGESRIVVDNGTFISSSYYLPHIGYNERFELTQDRDRKRHGLAPKPRMHDLDDAAYHQRNYITGEGDWIDFDATVSTSPEQIAVAPGRLDREWSEGGRRYFHYSTPAPILDFYAFLSARYAVKRDEWRGDGKVVPIEIDYQPGHEYNLERMIAAVKDSLDDYTKGFSPYQNDRLRIVEFPRYATFAQSFPNTIPFSESIGFIAKVDPKDPKDIDYPYYVTAHEVAHQWWAHQVVGADVQGATMLSETLAQYSALMVMKHRYGDAKMKRFLKYELDAYLVGRATERKAEEPLYRNEDQPYIHYRKGSLAMYALQDYIGEDAVNRALASLARKWAFKGPPYPTSRDLLAEISAVTPPQYQYLVKDLFETITLYENRAVSAVARPEGDGRYEVKLTVDAKKLRADETGAQREVPMDDWIDIGVLGKDDAPLYLQKQQIRAGRNTFTLEVKGEPLRAGIDPIVKLVDRRPDDNTVAVTRAER